MSLLLTLVMTGIWLINTKPATGVFDGDQNRPQSILRLRWTNNEIVIDGAPPGGDLGGDADGFLLRCGVHDPPTARPSRPANAPRFQAIASIPGMTATALSAALNTSHRAMPNILLATDEQADSIAYILSLK
jgi:hypothetical protein